MFFTSQDFELLCPDGGRKPPSEAADCNWGVIPSHIVMTSAIHEEALRKVGRSATVSLKIDTMVPYPCFKCMMSPPVWPGGSLFRGDLPPGQTPPLWYGKEQAMEIFRKKEIKGC